MKKSNELNQRRAKSPSIFKRVLKAVRRVSHRTAPALLGSVLLLFVAFDSQALILCRLGKEVRTLRTEVGDKTCKAIYTKQGVDSQIGASDWNAKGCEGIIEGVRKNLEGGGWKCKEAKESKVSDLSAGQTL